VNGAPSSTSALMLVGHGSRSAHGVAEYWRLAAELQRIAPALDVGCGFIELAEPDLDTGFDALVARGAGSVVAVPLVLLGASHLKADGPDAMARARRRHPGVHFAYARALGIHPALLALAETRVREAVAPADPARTHVVLVGRGSSDPDANADLYKVARLLWDGRGFAGVEPAFVSLAPPSVPEALERCRRLGARRIAVVPYFLFTGVLVQRIGAQARAWATGTGVDVVVGRHLGAVEPVARLVLERRREALEGGALMNCDLCIYRVALPGYEDRVVRYAAPAAGHHHRHQGRS
jgi:sirohydrochlorin ferrochelatase